MAVQLNDRATVPVACECGWDDDGTLVMVDVWKREYPPIPYVRIIEFDGATGDHDPPRRGHDECPACGAEFDELTVVERRNDDR